MTIMTMADFSVNIKIPEWLLKLDITKAVKESLFDSANLLRRRASQKAPVKTGTLRRSIDIQEWRNQVAIWSKLVYAPIQEFWWRAWRNWSVVIRPRRYLRWALEESWQDIERIRQKNIAEEILRLINKL